MKIINRIYQYIEYKGIKAIPFEKEIGLSNGYLGKQLKRNADLGEGVILKIIDNCPDLNINWLLTGEGEMLKPNMQNLQPFKRVTKRVTFSEETKNTKNVTLLEPKEEYTGKMPQVVTVDKQGNDNVVLVPVKAQAGYLTGFGDPTYIKKLPTYNLPNIKNGTFRMFQVNGHSMHPTLHDKSYVVGEWVENWVKDIKDNRLYIVVAESDNAEGVLIKRVLNRLKKYGNLYLKPDNRKEYYNITLQPDEIKEVWEVKLYLGWELPDPAVLYDRVSDLEADIEYLKDKLKGKN